MSESTATTPEPPVRKWGGGDVALGLLAAISGTLAFSLLYGSTIDTSPGERTLGDLLVGFSGLWAGWLSVVVLASKWKGARSLREDFGLDIKWPDLQLGIGLGIAAQAFVFVLYLPLGWLAPDLAEQVSDPAESLAGSASGLGLLPLGIALCLGAPFVEELFFRGLALRAFIYRWGRTAGIFTSSALFAAVHYDPQQLPLQLPALFGLAALLAVFALRRGRLGPAIVGHATFNGISYLLLIT